MPLPKLPDPENVFSAIDKAAGIIDKSLGFVDKVSDKLDQLGISDEVKPPVEAPAEAINPVAGGTACIPCSRDHLSVTSSALSEGIRFAREKGVKDHEVMRRIRIGLEELNIMERIDLAPEEIAKLKGAEKDLAGWTLKQSRDLRHAITGIRDVETLEQAAAKASQITEEFMSRLWEIPAEECETCGEVRESIRQFVEKRKRERVGNIKP